MKKRISEMTPEDKASFLEASKRRLRLDHGIEWSEIEPQIQGDIDAVFDDEKFLKLDPESMINAAYARKEFRNQKPDLVDYLLWCGTLVTQSDLVEWE